MVTRQSNKQLVWKCITWDQAGALTIGMHAISQVIKDKLNYKGVVIRW